MTRVFTPEEILAFVYGELDAESTSRLESMLTTDETLSKEVHHFRLIRTTLENDPLCTPSESVIARILEHAAEKVAENCGHELFQ